MIATPEQFAAARHKLGLSISQCARLVNVSEETVRRKWEGGIRDPHPSACRILEIALLGGIDPNLLSAILAGKVLA